jgi:hypothetical protein
MSDKGEQLSPAQEEEVAKYWQELEKESLKSQVTKPYVSAHVDPPDWVFEHHKRLVSFSVLDIGCGVQPRLSWELKSGDFWVGCDPNYKNGLVYKGSIPMDRRAVLTIFRSRVEDVPEFKPDLISVIAPNQQDIADGQIFNDEIRKFLDPQKEQTLVVVLDTRTVEAFDYQPKAKQIIKQWAKENGFKPDAENQILDKFRLNSADAGVKNIRLCYIRNPSR